MFGRLFNDLFQGKISSQQLAKNHQSSLSNVFKQRESSKKRNIVAVFDGDKIIKATEYAHNFIDKHAYPGYIDAVVYNPHLSAEREPVGEDNSPKSQIEKAVNTKFNRDGIGKFIVEYREYPSQWILD